MNSHLIYLASPYTHPDEAVRQLRFEQAMQATAQLMREGKFVYSPIAYSHPLAVACELPTHWDYWAAYDTEMIARCDSLVILTLPGWQDSKGVNMEWKIAVELRMPVEFMDFEVKNGS